MNFILGKKLRMTQIFAEDGKLIPVTEISVEPNTVLRVKGKEKDGYEAIVLAYGNRNKIKKSLLGLFKKLGSFRHIKEFRTEGHEITLKAGDKIGLNSFNIGDKIKATAVSKGKGFQGVVKRHGFHCQNAAHGNKDQLRMPGSIGATGPAHVFKGQRMPGRMGGDQVTLTNLEIVKIDLDNNLLYTKGAFAGGSNALVAIKGEGELKVYEKPVKEEPKEDKSVEEKKEKVTPSVTSPTLPTGRQAGRQETPEVKKEEVKESLDSARDDAKASEQKKEEKKEEPKEVKKEEKVAEKAKVEETKENK